LRSNFTVLPAVAKTSSRLRAAMNISPIKKRLA
jgi:hypothetical protein